MTANAREPGMTCAVCASRRLAARMEVEEFPYGTEGASVVLKTRVRVFRCHDCQFEFTGRDAVKARHIAVCRHLGVMTPEEIRNLREQYRLSRADFASVTRIGEASLGRWEAGALLPSRAYDNYLYLLRYEENLVRLKNRHRPFDGKDATSAVV